MSVVIPDSVLEAVERAAEVPSPVFKSMCALAEKEGVPVERLASLAIARAVAVWLGVLLATPAEFLKILEHQG